MNTLGTSNGPSENKGEREMWVPLHSIQEIRKNHEKSFVQDMVTCLNMLPPKNGTSNDRISAEIILGSPNIDCNNLRTTFGEYAQIHIGTTKNTTQKIMVEIEV